MSEAETRLLRAAFGTQMRKTTFSVKNERKCAADLQRSKGHVRPIYGPNQISADLAKLYLRAGPFSALRWLPDARPGPAERSKSAVPSRVTVLSRCKVDPTGPRCWLHAAAVSKGGCGDHPDSVADCAGRWAVGDQPLCPGRNLISYSHGGLNDTGGKVGPCK